MNSNTAQPFPHQLLTTSDTKEAIRQALNTNGEINNIKAHLRRAIYTALTSSTPEEARPTAPPSPESIIINEMIREYLLFNGYDQSLAVFALEAGLPNAPVPRAVVASELGLLGAPVQVPLLYSVVEEGKLHDRDL